MHIKSMVLEGFKSYGKRVEINGFDKEFNAITGLNGSGKSNILDAICFVLGITNLSNVRATSLQDLVYKAGQAGIKKATVTITFDNSDEHSVPMGYESHKEITIARQVVIGGKNKYLLNGLSVPNKKVHDLFCSVQLNVNNPHFLIMQGRIVKLLNMKPKEILSMIEEAAGTSQYETKKQEALKLIASKDNKLKRIEEILNDELGPKLQKLREEKRQYIEFQRVERELEHYKKIYIAWKYVQALKNSEKAESDVKSTLNKIEKYKQTIKNGKEESAKIDDMITEIVEKRDLEAGGQMEEIESQLKEAEKKEHKLTAELKSKNEYIKHQETSIGQIKKNLDQDGKWLAEKQQEFDQVGGLFQNLKETAKNDEQAVRTAQEDYQKISAGLLQSDTGENQTLEQQVITAKKIATEAQTEVQQCEMSLAHNEERLKVKRKDMQSTDNEYKKDSRILEEKEKEVKTLENNLKRINYEEGHLEGLNEQKKALSIEIDKLKNQVNVVEQQYYQLRFNYEKPEPNFRDSSVKGQVARLIKLKDVQTAYALDIAAGGKLYNVIVDTEQTSKLLLQKGQIQQRVTIIPLNKIRGRPMDQKTVELAQRIGGRENVQPALNLIEFPEEVRPAMTWIFGQIFICKDMDVAKKIAFHPNIMKKCVTLEGDVVDPGGSLTGGAMAEGGSVLAKLNAIRNVQDELDQKKHAMREIVDRIVKINDTANKYAQFKKSLELKAYELENVRKKVHQTTHHQIKTEVENLISSIKELKEKMAEAKVREAENVKRAKHLEGQLKNASSIREKQLKDAENKITAMKKKAAASHAEWEKREKEAETLNVEITDLQNSIKSGNEQLAKAQEKLDKLTEERDELQRSLNEAGSLVKERQMQLKKYKDQINQQNKEIQKLTNRKEEIAKQAGDTELEIVKLNQEITSIKTSAGECKSRLNDLVKKHEWIEQEKKYFGEADGMYDFKANNPDQIEHKVKELENVYEKMSRNVNTRSINLLNNEEENYNAMISKKRKIENDKSNIIETIKKLDEKKRKRLLEACKQVNKDFGSIFSTLLPGACAKLEPPENQSVLDGLEVKVGFSNVWKESLGELSGGQRSLVALSLILAMLLFKPAPLYILDEVDAALDISHTENIGKMLKKHFKRSQFIIVSLKDGMFNNANVLFTTKFVDGMSTIGRTVKH